MNDKTYAHTADGLFSVQEIRRRKGFPRICWLLIESPGFVVIRLEEDEINVLPVFSSKRKARKFIVDNEELQERPLNAALIQDNLADLIERGLPARAIVLNIDLDEPKKRIEDQPHIFLPQH